MFTQPTHFDALKESATLAQQGVEREREEPIQCDFNAMSRLYTEMWATQLKAAAGGLCEHQNYTRSGTWQQKPCRYLGRHAVPMLSSKKELFHMTGLQSVANYKYPKVIFLISFLSAKWQQHFQDTIFSIYLNLSFSLFEVSAADLDAFASRPLHALVEKHALACPWLLGHLATETPHHVKVTFSFSTLLRFVVASQRVYSLWKMICQAHSLRRSSRRGSFFQPRVGSCALKWNRT